MLKLKYDNIIFSLQRSGGISVYWKELIERLVQEKEIETKFIEYKGATNNIFRREIKLSNRFLKIKSSFPSLSILRYLNLRSSESNKHIFHSSYYRTMRGTQAINVVTVHDFTYEKKVKSLKGKAHIIQKKNAIKKANGIICISKNTKDDLLDLYPQFSNKNIKVIYNGFNSKDYFPLQEAVIENSLLFVGARKGYKNFDKVVDVLSNMKDYNLRIVGSKLDSDERDLLESKIPGRYSVFEHIDNKVLNELYNTSLCLMYLSEYEGFGIPVLEANSAGCPVIALKRSSIPEVAGDAAILFETVDINEIRKTIIKLKMDSELRRKYIKLGFNNATRFSWDKCYSDLIAYYQELYELEVGNK